MARRQVGTSLSHASRRPCRGVFDRHPCSRPDGHTTVLEQQRRQTAADFLFEGAGQGCTFVVRADFYNRVRGFVEAHQDLVSHAHYHDWTIYALARAWGESWIFDTLPTVTYRQHETNDTGARGRTSSISKRVGLIRRGWYQSQLSAIAAICAAAAPADTAIANWISLFHREYSWRRRLQVALFCMSRSRRRVVDRIIVVAAGLLGWIDFIRPSGRRRGIIMNGISPVS